ncbi:unnamed protein product [Tilletia controversa]|nr:unnamed protein product [Tilletia controversa]
MPAARRNPESIQQEIGPHFKVVAGQFPVNVQCLACKHEGARPFRYKQSTFQDHINSRKHQKNAKACNPVSFNDLPSRFDGGAPNDTNDDDDGPGFADDVALPRWYEGERVDTFWSIAEQRDDVIAGLEVELAELRREDEEMADAHRNITGHLLGQEEGAWGPFKDKGMFAALSFLLSPRQAHSLISLEHALGLAEALGAPHVPSINVCKKALARIYLAGKEKLVRSTDVEGNIFWRNSIAHLIRDDFGNSHVRAKMHLLPRRAPVVKELRDGAALAHNVDERTAAPMVRLANGKEFWIREVYEYGEQLVFPQCFFEGEDEVISGEGRLVRRNEDVLLLTEDRIIFRADRLKVDTERKLSRLSLMEGDDELPHTHPERFRSNGKRLYSVPIVVFIDDLSGARSKRWNKHEAIYFSNATLDRCDLDLDSNIKLVSISKDVTGENQLSAVVDELIHLHQHPVSVFDCVHGEEVLVRPFLLAVMADNPMAASLTSSIGLMGNKCCRMCHIDGGKEALARTDGFVRFLKPGDARSSQSIKAALSDQLDAAEKGRPHSDLTALRKETGVKDTLTTKHCDNLLDLRKDLRDQGRSRDEVDRIVSARRVEITVGHWYGPLLRLHGLPIEALHTWLLGPVKYLVAEVARTVKQTGALFREAATRISSVNLDGIGDSASLDGYYLLNNAGGLTGKDMRALAQVLWLALFPLREQGLIKESLWEACRWMGVVTRLILVEEIPRNEGDEYQRNFSTALSNFFAAMLNVDPKQLKSKRKYHLLTHFFRDGALFQMYGMEARKKKAVPGYFQRQQVERTVVTKEHAQAAEHLFAEEYVASSEVEYCSLRFIVSPAHEHVYPDSFVQVNAQTPPQENDEGRMTTSVVRIIALFGDPVGLLDEHPEVAKEPLALVQPMFAAALDAHGVRSLIYGQGRFLIPFAAIRAKFNISHHCARHECPIVDTRQRRQEREIVNATSYEVVHDLDDAPQIAILNDALCRSGWNFHHIYSVLGQPRSFEDVIRNL